MKEVRAAGEFNSQSGEKKSPVRELIDMHKNRETGWDEFKGEVAQDAADINTRRNYDDPKTGAHRLDHD